MRIKERNALVLSALPKARELAYYFISTMPPRARYGTDELISVAMIAAIKAAPRFQKDRGVTFPVFVGRRMLGAMQDLAREQDPLSRDHRRLITRVRKAREKLGEEASIEQICQHAEINPQAYYLAGLGLETLSIDAPIRHGTDLPLRGILRNPEHIDPGPAIQMQQAREILERTMCCLPPRYRRAVDLYFFGDLTMEEIGKEMGVNFSRVSQMISASMKKCRAMLAEQGIERFDQIAA